MRVHHGRRPPRGRTVLGELEARFRSLAESQSARAWPSTAYQIDPVGFARDILGVELWDAQTAMLEGVRDHKRVAVAGGRKIGKDFAVACIALWWYASFPDARVICTATRAEQVDGVLYREIRKLFRGSGLCVDCRRTNPDAPRPCAHSAILTGKLGDTARSGIKDVDGREIRGTTANEAESMAGTSGANLLYVLDEASAIADSIFDSVKGNVAAGSSRIVLISNPTREKGFFHEAFHTKRDLYWTLQVSSEQTPNVLAGETVIPGLASREWIEDMRRDWGTESPMYAVHVRGEFAELVGGRIFAVAAIIEAERRWNETEATGRLFIGCDPAGASGQGDESAFAVRRGKKISRLYTRRGLTDEGHVTEIEGLLRVERQETDAQPAMVVVDRDGPVGDRVYRALCAYASSHSNVVRVHGHRGANAPRKTEIYGTARDELYASLEMWMREGGALPVDAKLEAELAEFRFDEDVRNRLRLTSKDDLRSALGRSPDRADAVALACLEVAEWRPAPMPQQPATSPTPRGRERYIAERTFNPYSGFSYDGGFSRRNR